MKKIKKLKLALMCLCAVLGTTAMQTGMAAAACADQSTEFGTVEGSFNISEAGSYRVWSRIYAPDMNNNSFILEVDGTNCNIVVGDTMLAVNTWTWVDYKEGSEASKIDLDLSAGNHTYKIYGREENVRLDRIVFAKTTACDLPVGNGDNCLPTVEPTPTPSESSTPTPSGSATPTPSGSSTPTPSGSATPTPSGSSTPTPSGSATPTPSGSSTPTPSGSATPTPNPKAADLDGNGQIDGGDLTLLFSKYNQQTAQYDLTGDGKVNIADLAVLLGNYGK